MPKTRSASKARKSERLNKHAALKPRDGRKLKSTQNGLSSPLRKSRKGKTYQASISSSSRRSNKSSSSMGLKTTAKKQENTIKELASKTDEVKREQQESKFDCKTMERMNARTYRAMLKMSRRKVKSSVDDPPVKSCKTCGDGLDESPHKSKELPDNKGEALDGPLGRSEDKCSDVDVKGSEPDSQNAANGEDGLEFPCSTEKDNLDVDDKGLEPDVPNGIEPLKIEDGLESSCSAERENFYVDDKASEPVLQNTASESLNSTDGLEFSCSAMKDNLDLDDRGLEPVLLNTASESLKSTDRLEFSFSAEKDSLNLDDKGLKLVLQNTASESSKSTDGLECSAEKDNLDDDDDDDGKGLDSVLQNTACESSKSTDGLEFSCSADKDYLEVDDKGFRPGEENSTYKSSTNEDCLESSFCTLKDNHSKSMEVVVDRYNSDFMKSANETIEIEDDAGPSCFAQKDNCRKETRAIDEGCLQVSDAKFISFPSTGGDEVHNDISNRESTQVVSSVSDRNHEDVLMVADQNSDKDLCLESGREQISFKSQKDDDADLVSVNEVIPDSMNKLSLITAGGTTDVCVDADEDMTHTSMVKDCLSEHSLSVSEPESSRFVEYWVPVQVSNLQLELYCSNLLSNLTALSSTMKLKNGFVHEVLVSTLKCCNHPYVVEPSLQLVLTQGNTLDEICNVGCKASGKLQLLDAILTELKDQGLRFLILYQPIGGSGRDNFGDILDDYIRIRFGTDSYEHIDGVGSRNSALLAACNRFNTVEGRFIFLLKQRACHRILKLSSVDAVIIYNSDLNPLNDLRALQRITMDSKPKQIKVFRLYSYHTVEENILAYAKKQINFGSSLQSITASNSHMLLMPGASYLFLKLDEFHHDDPDATAGIVSKYSFNKDVLQELFSLTKDHSAEISVKLLSKAEQNGGNYQKKISLLNEMESQPVAGELPCVFWKKLTDARYPIWKYLSTPLQRNRKRVHYFESGSGDKASQKDDNPKKRKRLQDINVDTSIFKDGSDVAKKYSTENEKGIGLPAIPQVSESEERSKLLHEQRCLLQFLKPKVSELCEVMQLQESVTQLAESFLEYVIHNRRLSRESETILQAFQISVCWTAASLLDQKIIHKESLVLARERLKLGCNEDEAELIFSKLQSLKEMYLGQSEELRSLYKKDTSYPSKMDANAKEAAVSNSENASVENLRSSYPEWSSESLRTATETVELGQRDILRNIKRSQKKFRKQMEQTKEKHIRELNEFHQMWEEEKGRLGIKHRQEIILTQSIHRNGPSIKMDKLKHLANFYAQKLQELELNMTAHLKDLQATQQAEKDEQQIEVARLLEEVRAWSQVQRLNRPLSLASGETAENLHAAEQIIILGDSMDSNSSSKDPLDESRPNEASRGRHEHHVEPSKTSSAADFLVDTMIEHDIPCDSPPLAVPSLRGSLKMPATQELQATGMDETMAETDAPVGTNSLACDESTIMQPSTASSSMLQPEGHGARSCQLAEAPGARAEAVSELHDIFLEGEASLSLHTSRIIDDAIGVASTLHTSRIIDDAIGVASTRAESTHIPHFPPNTPSYEDLLGEFNTSQQPIFIPMPGHQNLVVRSSFAPSNTASESHFPPRVTYPFRTEILLPAAMPAHSEPHCLPMQVFTQEVTPSSSRMTLDPLHNELERIQKQKDLATETHIKMLKQLESDRDQEIARILQKYNSRCAEAEASFLSKRKELDLNENKVKMNKFLAFALCAMQSTEFGAASQIEQAGPSSDPQLSHQVPHPAFNVQNSTPAGRVAHRSLATFPSHPSHTSQARPPQVSSITPTAGSQRQFRSEVRAPPSHLWPVIPPPFSGVSALIPGVASPHTTSSGVVHSTSHLQSTR